MADKHFYVLASTSGYDDGMSMISKISRKLSGVLHFYVAYRSKIVNARATIDNDTKDLLHATRFDTEKEAREWKNLYCVHKGWAVQKYSDAEIFKLKLQGKIDDSKGITVIAD